VVSSVRQLPRVLAAKDLDPATAHLSDAQTGVSAWFLAPAGMITRTSGHDVIDLPVAETLLGPFWRELDLLARTEGVSRVTIVHDWSGTRSYAANARNRLTTWCIDHRDRLGRVAIVSPPAGSVVRAGLELAASLLSVADIELVIASTLDEVIGRWDLSVRPTFTRSAAVAPPLAR